MTRRVIGPFNRVEGDLEVHVEYAQAKVSSARVVSPLFRGFEQILHGKDPRDAMVYTPRICGICSVSQSVAAATALAAAQDLVPPPNGEGAVNLILANENVADHLTHFYLFFMPDFAREVYAGHQWHEDVAARFRAVSGTAGKQVLSARADFMHLMGMLAGKWPHSLAIQPGGTTRSVMVQEQMRISTVLFGFRRFLESVLFGDDLERIIDLGSVDELQQWREAHPTAHSDFSRFLHLAESLSLSGLGRASDLFMSYGAYREGGTHLFSQGVFKRDQLTTLDPQTISEDVSHSWMSHDNEPRHPYEGVTQPELGADDGPGYSWCKAPRLDGQVVEVGALARQVVDGHPLIRELVASSGGNVQNRVIARLLEIARVVVAMEDWARGLQPGEAYCSHGVLPESGSGCGMVEAARGSLGHWLRIKNHRIFNYQIIAPTTWNFSPRDARGTPGSLEQALVGAPVLPGEEDPVSVQHIVRSFDPCMVCTVH